MIDNSVMLEVGQLIAVVRGLTVEIGKIKSFTRNGAFVYYHTGSTAALTPYGSMYQITNAYCIPKTSFNTTDLEEVQG